MTLPAINNSYKLGANEGDSHKATGLIAVAHSTANPDASAKNNAAFEKRTWSSAYVHFIVDDTGAYAVGEVGYRAYGAYGTANTLSPLQVELCEFTDRTKALKAYANYVALIHDYCVKLGIPLTLDDGMRKGIKTHKWVSANFEGDHTDPVAYLASIGISQAQFAADLKAGKTGVAVTASTPAKAVTKAVVKPNVTYEFHQLGGSWLGPVTNFGGGSNGFAGNPNHRHDMIYIKADHGTIRYHVHLLGGGWLPWITKGDKSDTVNGCAGMIGHAIDLIAIQYLTPSGEPYHQAYYRSQTTKRAGWLPVVCDDGKSLPQYTDQYAGILGEPMDRLQIDVTQSNPF